jgi:hypothetical protein
VRACASRVGGERSREVALGELESLLRNGEEAEMDADLCGRDAANLVPQLGLEDAARHTERRDPLFCSVPVFFSRSIAVMCESYDFSVAEPVIQTLKVELLSTARTA